MPRRNQKQNPFKKYPVIGKDALNSYPVTPSRRNACEQIRLNLIHQIDSQIKLETFKKERIEKRARLSAEHYSKIDRKLKALSK